MRNALILILLMGLMMGCKKNKSVSSPGKAVLIFPDKDAACIAGTIISATENTVPFSWTTSEHTDSYEVNIKNLLTNIVTKYTANQPGLQITLTRNTPYAWYVISKSDNINVTDTSQVWKFYNSGPGIVAHAPFPADLITPDFGKSITATAGKITLDWDCSDVDTDIVSYDIYLGTTTTPVLLQAGITASTLTDISVMANTIYYWRVIARDSKGNTSTSEVYQFKVN